MVVDCPETKGKPSTSKMSDKKKALKSTWDSESESEEEVNTANMCFMVKNNTPKVTSKLSLDECELTMDELGEAFEELSNNYDFLKKKYLKMRKKIKIFKIKLSLFLKKMMLYLSILYLHKRILMHTTFHIKQNFP